MIIPVTSRKFDAITRATVVPNSVTKDEKECSVVAAIKVIYPKYYKHSKKGAHQSHLGRQKMG